jgi:hypothetical protein
MSFQGNRVEGALASLEKPPNHKVFDEISSQSLAQSSLLQQPLNQAQINDTQNAIPTIHVQLPNSSTAPISAPAPAPLQPQLGHAPPSTLLVGTSLPIGPSLALHDFCAMYNLSKTILTCIEDNAYNNTDTFKYIMLSKRERRQVCKAGGTGEEAQRAIGPSSYPARQPATIQRIRHATKIRQGYQEYMGSTYKGVQAIPATMQNR